MISLRVRNRNLFALIPKHSIDKDPCGNGSMVDGILNLGNKGSEERSLAATSETKFIWVAGQGSFKFWGSEPQEGRCLIQSVDSSCWYKKLHPNRKCLLEISHCAYNSWQQILPSYQDNTTLAPQGSSERMKPSFFFFLHIKWKKIRLYLADAFYIEPYHSNLTCQFLKLWKGLILILKVVPCLKIEIWINKMWKH